MGKTEKERNTELINHVDEKKTDLWNTLKKVIVIGGSNIDIKGSPFTGLKEKTSNPGMVTTTLGGVGRNIAHNLALLGVPVTFLSVVGEDDWGKKLLEVTEKAGVNTKQVKISKKSGTGKYLVILDEKGDMKVAVSDMKACKEMTVGYIKSKEKLIRESDIVVIDTNLPEKTIRFLANLCSEGNIKLVVEPVSVEKSKKLKKVLDKIDYITPNQEELEAMAGGNEFKNEEDMLIAVEKLRNKGKGVKNVILTLGERGVFLSAKKGNKEGRNKNSEFRGNYFPAYKVEAVEVTGVGDALVAGLIYGIFKGYSLAVAVNYGQAAAALTISTPDTINLGISEGILNVLVEQNRPYHKKQKR